MIELLAMTPVRYIVTMLLVAVALMFAWRCIRSFRMVVEKQVDTNRPMMFVRALRGLVISLTALAWAAGTYWGQGWLLIIGLVILAQEMYEMGVLSLILKYGDNHIGSRSARDHP